MENATTIAINLTIETNPEIVLDIYEVEENELNMYVGIAKEKLELLINNRKTRTLELEAELEKMENHLANSEEVETEAKKNNMTVEKYVEEATRVGLTYTKQAIESHLKKIKIEDERGLAMAEMFTTDYIDNVNAGEVFNYKVNYTNKTFQMSLKGVVSKDNYKKLAEASINKRFNPKDFVISFNKFETLATVIKKSSKLKQDTLKTILECRLAGLYKAKDKDGKVWNKGGIDKA